MLHDGPLSKVTHPYGKTVKRTSVRYGGVLELSI